MTHGIIHSLIMRHQPRQELVRTYHSVAPATEDLASTLAAVKSQLSKDGAHGALLRQVLLHLYRLGEAEITDPAIVEREIDRIRRLVAARLNDVPQALETEATVALQDTHLDIVDAETGELIHAAYHYLGSPRDSSIHLGLYANKFAAPPKLMTLLTLSRLDLPHVIPALPDNIQKHEVMVVSRMFSFSWCPRNTMSHTLGLAFSWIRKEYPHVKMFLTYLDPNLGFRGTVYRATNWILFGHEKKQRYLYLDDDYVTDRKMIKEYGTADLEKLRAILGDRIASSRHVLQPLELYVYFLDPIDRARHLAGFSHVFTPPPALVGG